MPPQPEPVQEPAPTYQEPVQQPAPAPEPVAAPVPEPVASKTLPEPRRRLEKKASPSKPKEDRSLIPVLLLVLLLFAFSAGAGFFVYKEMKNRSEGPVPAPLVQNPAMAEGQYIRAGWKKEAYSVLEKFVAAKSVEEKLPYVIQSANLKANMDSFYGGSTINDQDTPADAFSVVDLTEADHKRGIFLMIFDQPPQFDIKDFFRPLAPLEVQYGIDEANLLLSTFAKVGNFATEPVRVNAFFKKTPEGLKLDWETFAQSKYRTFRNMTELPDPGQSAVFRIQISEDVPETGKPLPPTQKTYRVFDPSSPEVSARINVNVDSEIGRTLSEINWMGAQNRPIIRTATLELKWTTGDQPELQINRFICWEFLHLGGQADPLAAPKR